MPHNEKVTFPEGTGGFGAFWAMPTELRQAILAKVAADRRKRGWVSFMTVQVISLSIRGLTYEIRSEAGPALSSSQDLKGGRPKRGTIDAVVSKNFFLASGHSVLVRETHDFKARMDTFLEQ